MSGLSYVCDQCGNVDNAAITQGEGGGFLCMRCRTGQWHGAFEEEKYDPLEHTDVINRVNSEFDDNGEPSFS